MTFKELETLVGGFRKDIHEGYRNVMSHKDIEEMVDDLEIQIMISLPEGQTIHTTSTISFQMGDSDYSITIHGELA